MSIDRLLLTAGAVLVVFVGACIATARVLRDYCESWEGQG